MLFAPFERLTIETPLAPEEVRRRLAQVIEPKKFRFFSRDHKPYQGNLNDDHFEVSRIIHYRNSFLPVIKGDIRPGLGGSVIEITMHPHLFVIVFLANRHIKKLTKGKEAKVKRDGQKNKGEVSEPKPG